MKGETINIYVNHYESQSMRFLETITPEKIFIGKSPKNKMTEFSGGYGKKFDGNTILLHLFGNTYMFIGGEVIKFVAESKITTFVSPVGNSAVPYPFAVDESGNSYLLPNIK